MVSIVLLTTEEVLQRNGFWYCLDTVWITEELEPFEEVKHEHLFIKPLSRDFYYAKYPDIPRSESEDENSLSLDGFRNKHREWKAKICVKRFEAKRRNLSSQLSWSGVSNPSIDNVTRRVTSLEEENKEVARVTKNDGKVRDFFNRLLESVPPPPIEDLQEATDLNTCSVIETPHEDINFSDIDVPDYVVFEQNKILQVNEEQNILPTTSTLKKTKRKVSFNLNAYPSEFESDESWYDSIYGVSALIESTEIDREDNKAINDSNSGDYFPSWSEILNECGIYDSILLIKESSISTEEILSQSHCADRKIQDYMEIDDDENEETGYARFAIYKIHQTLKIQGKMLDSSPMNDFNCDNENNVQDKTQRDPTFFGAVYRLAPKADEVQESVNNVASTK